MGQGHIDFGGLCIDGCTVPVLDLGDGPPLQRLTLRSLIVGDFLLPDESVQGPRVEDSIFERVFGVQGATSFPTWVVGCSAESYDDASTNADILRDGTLPVGVRVALTMLRKLFVQRGHGRKENALSRGMAQDARGRARRLLPILQSEGLAFAVSAKGTTLWHPVQGQRRRAQAMLDSPTTSQDPFLRRARSL